MVRHRVTWLFGCLATLLLVVGDVEAGIIGVDSRNGISAEAILATGGHFDVFRATITGAGHSIVPLNSFLASDFAGLDAVILKQPFSIPYSASERSAIHNFIGGNVVLFSDTSMFKDFDVRSDRPITFGDNNLLLSNAISFITSTNQGAIFLADVGGDFDVANMNALVAPFGVTYSSSPTEISGRTITGFVPHPVTAGLSSIGVDFQLRMTSIVSPAIDLTTGGGADNALAAVPEPSTLALASIAGIGILGYVRRRLSKS